MREFILDHLIYMLSMRIHFYAGFIDVNMSAMKALINQLINQLINNIVEDNKIFVE